MVADGVGDGWLHADGQRHIAADLALDFRELANGGGVAISWASMAGRLYNLERTYDLVNWVAISENTAATPPLNTVIDPVPTPLGKAFYRLTLLESTSN